MPTFEIGIPTLNRFDLLMPSLLMYQRDFPDTKIWVIDNGKQGIRERISAVDAVKIELIENDSNIGVAASWNVLCDKIFESADNALILNDDIYMGKKKADIQKTIADNKKGSFMRATIDWCAFIMPKGIWNEVGRFDECFFPAYYEDRSYEYRMKLKNLFYIRTPELNPFLYKSSQTIEKEPSILEASKKNKQLYIEMWGGEPEKETFKTSFNK